MISKFQDLKNKNVIVTGGSGFIGKQICTAFLSQGSNVYVFDLNFTKIFNRQQWQPARKIQIAL